MFCARLSLVLLVYSMLLPSASRAQSPGVQPDPLAILGEAKTATGGAAWDGLRSQHTKVKIATGGIEGSAERWASLFTGRSRMRFAVGTVSGTLGYDGINAWSQDALGQFTVETDANGMELAANAAFRDRLAFWFPARQAAKIEFLRREKVDGEDLDVIKLTPEGGHAFEFWVNAASHRIERLRELEHGQLRTEVYSDFRTVQGVTLPFSVQASHGDPRTDERYTVDAIEYNVALDGVEFSPPAALKLPLQRKP